MHSYFKQYSETAELKEVVIGRHQGYAAHDEYVEIVNEEQKKGLPDLVELAYEFEQFKAALEAHGVQVHTPDYVGKFVYDQLTPRDIGITIGPKFVIAPMLKSSRKYEVAGIFQLLKNRLEKEPNILIPDGIDVALEGGDIIVDQAFIFAGISQRTNEAGIQFLRDNFSGEFEIVPVHCKPLEEGENILHLDCTFNPVGESHALIYPGGFVRIPEQISNKYDLIEITKSEQEALSTNVLSLDRETVIVRDHEDCNRVNDVLRSIGLNTIELPFNGAPSSGGSFRCCSLPLVRE